MSENSGAAPGRKRRAKRFLSPSQKYEIYLHLVRQEVTIAESAATEQVDRSTIIRIRTVAKEGAVTARTRSATSGAATSPASPRRPLRSASPTRPSPRPDVPGGYRNVHVGVQRRNRPGELLGLTPGDAPSVTWTLGCSAVRRPEGLDLKGPHVQGPPGGRFVYLSWGTVGGDETFELFRRAKLRLDAIPAQVLATAIEQGILVGRLTLTDSKGHPLCATVRPPLIEWSAAWPAR